MKNVILFTSQAIAEDERLLGFHASLASPGEGNIPGFPKTPGNRCHMSIKMIQLLKYANLTFESIKQHLSRSPKHCNYNFIILGTS